MEDGLEAFRASRDLVHGDVRADERPDERGNVVGRNRDAQRIRPSILDPAAARRGFYHAPVHLSMRSGFEGQPLHITWAYEPTASDIEELRSAYRQKALLDPVRLAPSLRGLPCLLFLARSDRIVAAEAGALLYELLGRPDLYSFPFGHGFLFWRLSAYRSEIADWIERTEK
jgi:hypothetical protein